MSEGKRNANSGMEIAAPSLMEQKPSAAENAAFSFTVVLLGVLGAAWCFISAFSLPVLPLTVNLYALLFAAVFTVSYSLKRAHIYIHFLLVILYAAAAWYFRAGMAQGFVITTNQIMKTYASRTDLDFPIYLVSVKKDLYPETCTLFLVFVLFIVTGLVCNAVIKQKSLCFTFLVTSPFLFSALAFLITPNFTAVLSLFACWTAMLLTRLPAEKKKGFLKIKSGYMCKSGATAARSGLISIPALLLCFALILSLFPMQNFQRPPQLDKMRAKLIETAADSPLMNGSRALAGNTNHVDLNHAGNIQFTGKTALQIKSDKQYPLYLKSFAGSVFTGSRWEKLPDSEYAAINRQLGGRNVQNMLYWFTSLLHQQDNPLLNPFGIRIRSVSASKQCIYAPYNLSTTPEAITGVHFVNDEFIRSDSLFGTSEYTFYAYGLGPGEVSSNISGLVYSLITKRMFPSTEGYNIPNHVMRFFESQEKYNDLNTGNVESYYKTTIPENILQEMDIKSRSYMETEQAYRLFLYDKYTQLPQSTREKVQKLLKQEGLMGSLKNRTALQSDSNSGSDVESMANAVKDYLSKNCYYTLNPGKIPKGEDFTEYFLTKSRRGYCVHFATAAAVMLRTMGVPARYAEGYIVTPQDYKNALADGWANIPDSRAHAWVEIYYPGLGWQPREVTPGFRVERNLTQENNPVNQLPEQSVSESSSPTQGKAASKPGGQAESKAPNSTVSSSPNSSPKAGAKAVSDTKAARFQILIGAAILLALLAFTILKRKYILSQREECFAQPDFRQAAISVYTYLTQLTQFGGEISEEINDLAQKAKFSRNGVTKEELKAMTEFAHRLALENYKSLPKWKQILFKYIYNLL